MPTPTARFPAVHTLAGLVIGWSAAGAAAEPGDARSGVGANSGLRFGQTALATATVENCADSGRGSLRSVVASHAAVIDLTALSCSTISLTTGAIIVDHEVANVTFYGPGDHVLTIDGNNNGRVLVHNGEGMLTLDHVRLANGSYTNGYYGGGCVYAFGSMTLQNATIANCTLSLAQNLALGGGIFVKHDLTLDDSVLSGNIALGNVQKARGGGAYVGGKFDGARSTIRDNSAFSNQNSSRGGGIYVFGTSQLYAVTVSGNQSQLAGGLVLRSNSLVTNSTISGNAATTSIGGLYAPGPLILDNSTVAFNTNAQGQLGAGVRAFNGIIARSSIVANNTATIGGSNFDIQCLNCAVTGSKNLIMSADATVPGDTITADPKLAPLADNGGPTRTHALLAGSPAFEGGSNIHDFAFDQRGRLRHVGAAPDIGAFESDDAIFADGFD